MSGGHTGDELQLDNVFFWREKVADGIESIFTTQPSAPAAQRWFTLDGRMLSGKPTTAGIYICNGKKYVVK